MTDLCGKPTKRGTPCQQYRATLEWLGPKADGCFTHMSDAERAILERRKNRDREMEERWFAAEPACWSWPVPENLGTWARPRDPELSDELNELFDRQDSEDPEARARSLVMWWQDGRCAVCGHRYGLVEDHDHGTGLTRGWLCHSCNIREGMYRGAGNPFERYRSRPPVAILGVRLRYWHPILGDYAKPLDPANEADKWTDAASEDIGL
ncbi:endonuclease domain-containing protein [Streptomyces sp. NPDC002402]